MRSKYSGAAKADTGPISAILLPPEEDPPFGPSVNSQALPEASAASAVGPAAACAWARVGKLSIRQNSGPGGNCRTLRSAIDLTSHCCAASGSDTNSDAAIAANHAKDVRLDWRRIIVASLGDCPFVGRASCQRRE